MSRSKMTDEQIEQEIAKLKQYNSVKLEKKEARIKYRKRAQLYNLRNMKKRGEDLIAAGITFENIEKMLFSGREED